MSASACARSMPCFTHYLPLGLYELLLPGGCTVLNENVQCGHSRKSDWNSGETRRRIHKALGWERGAGSTGGRDMGWAWLFLRKKSLAMACFGEF